MIKCQIMIIFKLVEEFIYIYDKLLFVYVYFSVNIWNKN